MSSRPPIDGRSRPRPLEVAIVGNDLLLAAFPARPVQMSHAILACGYDHVVPVSWGEEIVAEHALRTLAGRAPTPVIVSACPHTSARLLSSGPELERRLVTLVSPAVATARYLRALHPTSRLRITFIGGCETLGDPAINSVIAPGDFLRRLAERGISAVRQPAVFESIIPPDRRRYYSRPGGGPSAEALARHAPEWQLATVAGEHFSVDLAELLLSGEPLVIDVADQLGCPSCAGELAEGGRAGEYDRPAIRLADLEPPRSPSPVLDHDIEISVAPPPGAQRAATAPPVQERAMRQPTGLDPLSIAVTIAPAPQMPVTEDTVADARDRAAATRRHIAITPATVPVIGARGGGGASRAAFAPRALQLVVDSERADERGTSARAARGLTQQEREPVVSPAVDRVAAGPVAQETSGHVDSALRPVDAHEAPPPGREAEVPIPTVAEEVGVSRRRRSSHAAFHAARIAAMARAAKEGSGQVVRTFASRRFTPATTVAVVEEVPAPADVEIATEASHPDEASAVVEATRPDVAVLEVAASEVAVLDLAPPEVAVLDIAPPDVAVLEASPSEETLVAPESFVVVAAAEDPAPDATAPDAAAEPPEDVAGIALLEQQFAAPEGSLDLPPASTDEAPRAREMTSPFDAPLTNVSAPPPLPPVVEARRALEMASDGLAMGRGVTTRHEGMLAGPRVHPPPRREAGHDEPPQPTLTFFVLMALGILVAIVAIALILRRNPLAPS